MVACFSTQANDNWDELYQKVKELHDWREENNIQHEYVFKEDLKRVLNYVKLKIINKISVLREEYKDKFREYLISEQRVALLNQIKFIYEQLALSPEQFYLCDYMDDIAEINRIDGGWGSVLPRGESNIYQAPFVSEWYAMICVNSANLQYSVNDGLSAETKDNKKKSMPARPVLIDCIYSMWGGDYPLTKINDIQSYIELLKTQYRESEKTLHKNKLAVLDKVSCKITQKIKNDMFLRYQHRFEQNPDNYGRATFDIEAMKEKFLDMNPAVFNGRVGKVLKALQAYDRKEQEKLSSQCKVNC